MADWQISTEGRGADVDDTYDDIVHIGFVDLGRCVDVDLDPVLRVVLLDGGEQRAEPLGGREVTDDPSEVDLEEGGVN